MATRSKLGKSKRGGSQPGGKAASRSRQKNASRLLVFYLFGFMDEDSADDLLDEMDEFLETVSWPNGEPDAFKFKESEEDEDVKCAVELKLSAPTGAPMDKRDFAPAMALMEKLLQHSQAYDLDIEVDLDEEMVGSIDKDGFSPSLREGLIDSWATSPN